MLFGNAGRTPRTFETMTFEQRKFLVLSAWVAGVIAIGIILTIDKPDLWLLVATTAMLPAAIASWLWKESAVTLSQLVQRYRK